MFRPHYPPHIYLDHRIYFITARTVNQEPLFNTGEKKEFLSSVIKEASEKFKIEFYAWVILDNHYHLLIRISAGEMLPNFLKIINGKSAFLLNKLEKIQRRKVWFNYWDRCIRNEKDFWKHFNYIHHNPVKHGYVKSQDLVSHYQFCSYKQWLEKKGEEWLISCFSSNPIVDFSAAE